MAHSTKTGEERQMTTERVRFPASGANPPMLEGELWLPDGTDTVGGVVMTHPNSLRGGSMDSNTVMAVCQGLQAAGLASLRFNFRGVGASEGQYSDGVDEVRDVQGALAFLGAQPRVRADAVGLAGHSFGARVSLMLQAERPPIAALLLVAPPLPEPLPAERHPVCPYLVIIGDQDANLSDGVDQYRGRLPHPERMRLVPGVDHMWRGFEAILADAARGFFVETLATPAPR
jgi:alpha/beta superfamily hydrolase